MRPQMGRGIRGRGGKWTMKEWVLTNNYLFALINNTLKLYWYLPIKLVNQI